MPLDAGQTLRALKAAKEPIGFAFGVGKSTVLLAEKGKAGIQLAAQVKKESGASQICIGSAVWGSSGAILYCAKPLSGMQKSVEGWAKANGLSLKCKVETGEPPAKGKDKNGKDEDDDDQDPIFEPAALLKRLKQAKTKPIFFGFGIGAKGENLLTMHPTREGKKLFQLVRHANGATKGAFGTVTVDGQIAAFECEKKVPGLKAMLKALFKEAKLPFKPLIEDAEDDDEDAFDEKIKPKIAKLEAERKKLMPALKMVIRMQQDGHDKEVEAAQKTMDAALQKRDLDTAKKTLEELRKLAVHAGDTVAADEDDDETERKKPGKGDVDFKKVARTWQRACEDLAGDLRKLPQTIEKALGDGKLDSKLAGQADSAIGAVRSLYDYKGVRNALLNASNATKANDEGKRAKAVAICLARVRKLKAETKRSSAIDALEDLPEVKITIRKTMMSALTAMEDQLR